MDLRRLFKVAFTCLLLAGTGVASANTVNYILDQSNVLGDGVDYISVMISDDTEGQLDFVVTTLSPLSGQSEENYGIQAFGLNFLDGLVGAERPAKNAETDLQFILPDGWSVQYNKQMSEAGKFDVRLFGTGSTRQDPLEFSVTGLTLEDLVAGFAAHVAGFAIQPGECGPPMEVEGGRIIEGGCGELISSGFFYGGRLVAPPEVPLPPAVWLLISGLLGLAGIARRKGPANA